MENNKTIILRVTWTLLAVVVCSEIFLRLFLTAPVATIPDATLGWKYGPDRTLIHSSEGYSRTRTNELGFNDDPVNYTAEKKRIVALGDSYTEALHVSRDQNFTSIAEQMAPCVDVLNIGQSGVNPVHYPYNLSRVPNAYAADELVVVLSDNDFKDIQNSDFQIEYSNDGTEIIEIKPNNTSHISSTRLLFDPLLQRSSLATYLKDRFKQINWNRRTSRTPNLQDTQSTRRAKQTQDRNKFVVVINFVLSQLSQQLPTSILFIPTDVYKAHGTTEERETSVIASQLLEKIAIRQGLKFAKVTGLSDEYKRNSKPSAGFNNKSPTWGHLNVLGHRAVAKALVTLVDQSCDPVREGKAL